MSDGKGWRDLVDRIATVAEPLSRAEVMLATFPAVPTGTGDASIVEAHRQARALNAWLDSNKGNSDDDVNLVANAIHVREALIVSGRAEGPAAIVAKLRLLDDWDEWEIVCTAIDALERLEARGGAL